MQLRYLFIAVKKLWISVQKNKLSEFNIPITYLRTEEASIVT
jgi:hypothetical protein